MLHSWLLRYSLSTTSSSENHTTSTRGISATLHDISNTASSPLTKRMAKEKAACSINGYTEKAAARGVNTEHEKLSCNFHKCYRNHDQRNAMHLSVHCKHGNTKTFAILLFSIAITSWQEKIVEVSEMAGEVVGFSNPKIVSFFISSMESYHWPSEDMDMDFVKEELASDRGHGTGNTGHIIHDEEFQLEACKFVRANSCKKGEPNLNVEQFRQWMKSSYSRTVSWDTARNGSGFLDSHHTTTRRVSFFMAMNMRM